MKRLVLILMLTTAALSAYAQRGSKGQHTAAFTYGCNFTADKAWTTSLSYSNYRLYGTLDADFTYNHCEGSYKTYGAPVNNYMLSGGYSQRLIQNYRRTFILYAGINAAIGYTQCNKGDSKLADGILLTIKEEVSYAIAPALKMDWFVSKLFGFTFRVQDMIFIKSDLMQSHNAMASLGFKYLIQ